MFTQKVRQLCLCFAALAGFFSFSAGASDENFILPVEYNELKIMSYNVQNLFDAEHDRAKEDFEFLPKDHRQKENCEDDRCKDLDWTANKVATKIEKIREAIAGQGELPDILVLAEVENKKVIQQLAEALGFDAFSMTNSPDKRGIDLAVLFRKDKLRALEFEERELQNLPYASRNLSVLVFQLSNDLGGGILGIFPNHWPSQSPNNGTGRQVAASEARQFVDEIRYKYSNYEFSFVMTGDFNVVDNEDPNPINDYILDRDWDAGMKDVGAMAKRDGNPMAPYFPPGTYYYGTENTWSMFDRFFVDASLTDGKGLEVDTMSYRVNSPSYVTKANKDGQHVPLRYNHYSATHDGAGYSDHFGIVMKLHYQP